MNTPTPKTPIIFAPSELINKAPGKKQNPCEKKILLFDISPFSSQNFDHKLLYTIKNDYTRAYNYYCLSAGYQPIFYSSLSNHQQSLDYLKKHSLNCSLCVHLNFMPYKIHKLYALFQRKQTKKHMPAFLLNFISILKYAFGHFVSIEIYLDTLKLRSRNNILTPKLLRKKAQDIIVISTVLAIPNAIEKITDKTISYD